MYTYPFVLADWYSTNAVTVVSYVSLANIPPNIPIARRQVEEVLLTAKKYKPAVLQNESHPYLHEKDLRDYCAIHNIAFQVR